MSIWNRRKKYTMEAGSKVKKGFKVKLQLSKLLKRELYVTMFSISAVTLIILGSAYAVFSSIDKSKDYNVINVGTLEVSFDDTGSGLGDIIKLNNAFPVSDSTGLSSTGYKFKIKNVGSLGANYSIEVANDTAMIEADDCGNNLLPFESLRYSFNGSSPEDLESTVVADESSNINYVLETGFLESGQEEVYEIKMWISDQAGNEILGKHFHGKIVIKTVAEEKTPTAESCFTTTENGAGTVTISQYICGPTIISNGLYINNTNAVNNITDVIIPSTIGGKTVTVIGENAFTYTGLTSIYVPKEVISIKNSAFYFNNDVSSIVLNEGLVEIGSTAFSTVKVSSLTIPSTVKVINSRAFDGSTYEGMSALNCVVFKGKTSTADFTTYGSEVFDWLTGSNCDLHADGDDTNPCITWKS